MKSSDSQSFQHDIEDILTKAKLVSAGASRSPIGKCRS